MHKPAKGLPKILALPVDGRPVTREQVQQLALVAGCELLCPPVSALGYFREAADRDALNEWVSEHAASAQGFIFSLDMLVYGGLVPSRFIDDEQSQLQARLAFLQTLKARFPEKPLYGFCATMRMSNNNENEEEKRYWADYGTDIWAWSYHTDRFSCLGEPADKARAEAARGLIPEAIQQDYLATRARNFSVTQSVLELVEQGVIDRLILPQDDTAEYGFNIAERRALQAAVEAKALADKVLIYPGADEVIYTLLVHQLCHLGQFKPIKLALLPHHEQALMQMVARYEDRPVMESIRCQIHAAGAELVDTPEAADALIAVHCRGHLQGDWAMQYPLEQDLGFDASWCDALEQYLQAGAKPVALLDLAYANGADAELIERLSPTALGHLVAFTAWNTASNAIGSLVAQVCAAVGTGSSGGPENQKLLATRLLDDFLYQSKWRQTIRKAQQTQQTADGEQGLLESMYLPAARQWLEQSPFTAVALESVYYPWARTFEVGLVLADTPAEEAVDA
ncbi:DUF4127 family protein [Simiduia sp. 21SJ11W-1]|uniref:DUF4127 family protein n=1 Tax=Simiduia sp. 21SJ11W-1 TaxID=2909669 RepID=UPI00209F5BC6|nr:DUF4127 family protein [Simiduia sp. 21SJ11W-1]UTA48301.1 DUF4127 family protein [Simiduia sp. 21SJ11W-1]